MYQCSELSKLFAPTKSIPFLQRYAMCDYLSANYKFHTSKQACRIALSYNFPILLPLNMVTYIEMCRVWCDASNTHRVSCAMCE